MIGVVSSVSDDRQAVLIQFDRPGKYELDEEVNVAKRAAGRTFQQNSFYWSYLEWIIDRGGLRATAGRFTVEPLHDDIKAWISAKYHKTYALDFSTADMSISEFAEFFSLVDYELMNETLGIDTSGFHADYQEFKEWEKYNPNGKFRDFMAEKKKTEAVAW